MEKFYHYQFTTIPNTQNLVEKPTQKPKCPDITIPGAILINPRLGMIISGWTVPITWCGGFQTSVLSNQILVAN